MRKKSSRILSRKDVDDMRAIFVADPFLQEKDGLDYLFLEVMGIDLNNGIFNGDIGLAVAGDDGIFHYNQIVLDEPFHLSYPYVFEEGGSHYMIPESDTDSIRLYKATHFPYSWSLEKILLDGKDYADSSILRYGNLWWLFVSTEKSHNLELYYSDSLDGEWTAHPQNPIVFGNRNSSRPGGRVLEYDGRLYRYIQDTWPIYGNSVRIAEITELTTTTYEETITKKPLIKGDFSGWNALGMHTLEYVGDGRCFVDGR
jgi:hypothetical protein